MVWWNKSRVRVRCVVLVLVVGMSLWFVSGPFAAGRVELNVEVGGEFVDMRFPSLLTATDYAALGVVDQKGPLRLLDVPGQLLIVEFFSPYCFTCQHQAPYLESFYQTVVTGDLADKVRVLAVGVGSRSKHLREFRTEFKLTYPLAEDPLFERLLELGDPGGTPFTVFLLKRDSKWILADYHLGFQGDVELMARTRTLVEGKAKIAVAVGADESATYHPPLGLSNLQREERARQFLSSVSGRGVRVVKIELGDQGVVYQALDAAGVPQDLYARIASRDPVCDVCHAVHFLIGFDRNGVVRGFEPIYATKFGNEPWNEADTVRIRSRLRDRRMADLEFDPDVDAVTSATMSSALIFDEVRRTAALVSRL